MLREACKVIRAMWSEDYATYAGQRYQVDGAINEPKGAAGPPPLWIGGGGERVTLKLVAQYADACNVGGGNPDVCRQKLEILRGHCETVGRNYDDIIKSTSLDVLLLEDGEDRDAAIERNRQGWSSDRFSNQFLIGGVDVISERIEQILETGIDYIIAYLPRIAYDHTSMQRYAREVLSKFV